MHVMDHLPLKWIQLLYNKYCHLESLRSEVDEVEDPLKLSKGDRGKVKGWLMEHHGIKKSNIWKSLFECGVPANEIDHWMEEIRLEVCSGTGCVSIYWFKDMWLLPCACYLLILQCR